MKHILLVLISLLLCLPLAPAAAAQAGSGGPPSGTTPSGIPLADLEAVVDALVAAHLGVSTPGVAVVVVKDGEIVLAKGYGDADVAQGTPVDAATTLFEYGSVTKLFVYTTLMRLVEQGRLDLQADIRGYLPEGFLRGLRYDEPVTLLHVMNHQTGFEDVLFDTVLTPGLQPTFEEIVFKAQPEQVYRPGTLAAYSNFAVALAAYIAQGMLAEQSPAWAELHAYWSDTIFAPLGMHSAIAHPLAWQDGEAQEALFANKAAGYAAPPGGEIVPGAWSYIPLYPVGGVDGTAVDLARFAMALMPPKGESGPLFERRETLDEMLTQTLAMGPDLPGFAHGFIEWDNGAEYGADIEFGAVATSHPRALGHGGNTAFFSSQINIVPAERFGVVVLANAAGEMALTSGITEALVGNPDRPVPVAGAGGLPPAADVAGTYLPARRAHNTFLKVYAYLQMLTVEALDAGRITLSAGGQSGTYVQIGPYRYVRVAAEGPTFEHNLRTIYFEVGRDGVTRMSGDFVPLPRFHTLPWLLADMVLLALAIAFLLITPAVMGVPALRRRRRGIPAPGDSATRRITAALHVAGVALLANVVILVARLLMDNYRSFAEVRPQVLLNYLLAAVAAFVGVALLARLRPPATGGQRARAIATLAATAAVLVLMGWWGFFDLLY